MAAPKHLTKKTVAKVLINQADIKSAGGVAPRVRTQQGTVCIRCEPQALSDFSWRRCSRGGGRHELTSLVPGPREQFVDLLHRMVRQSGKDVGEPGLRIDVI